MTAYVQFLTKNLKGQTVEACGSDGVFILDGRNCLDTMINDAYEQKHKLRFVQKHYVGFEIRKGARFESYTVVHKEIL